MELNDVVKELIGLIKERPYSYITVKSLEDLKGNHELKMPDRKWFDNRRKAFQTKVLDLIKSFKVKLEKCNDILLVEEQFEKLNDTVFFLKEAQLSAKDNYELFNLKKEETDAFEFRLESAALIKQLLDRKLDGLREKQMKSSHQIEYQDYNLSQGLTEELNIGKVIVNMNGADLAFYLYFFKEAGWFKHYESKDLDLMFSKIIEQNMKVLFNKEYIFLKHFMSKLSYAKSFKSDDINVKREKEFKQALARTIKKVQETFELD